MRFTPTITSGIKDAVIRQALEFIFRLLGRVPEYNIYKYRTVWHVPYLMAVPTNGNTQRVLSPDVVRVGRALAVGDEITPVYAGAVLWKWTGSQVEIQDVEGLVDGVTYDLTFEVVSGS